MDGFRTGLSQSRVRESLLLAVAFLMTTEGYASVVISEIMYHPQSDDRLDEYVELLNTGDHPADLTGWSVTSALSYSFPPGVLLDPGGYLVVAADPARLRERFGVPPERILGPWDGTLANEGERIELTDAGGRPVCAVTYDDGAPWPPEADGGGPSLECINPRYSIETARNWSASQPGWSIVDYTGTATSSRLYVYLLGTGACLIDDVVLTAEDGGENHVPNGEFTGRLEPWDARGNHAASRLDPDRGYGAPGCLHLIAEAAGDGGTNGLVCELSPPLEPGATYRLSFALRFLDGSAKLVTRLSGGGLRADSDGSSGHGSPGRPNGVAADRLPPLVAEVTVSPLVPGEQERALVTAHTGTTAGCGQCGTGGQ